MIGLYRPVCISCQLCSTFSCSHDASGCVVGVQGAEVHCGSGQRSRCVFPVAAAAVELLVVWESLYTGVLLYYSVLHCTLLHCTPLYSITLYSTVLYYTVLHCTLLLCTPLYSITLYSTVLYYSVLHCTLQYCSTSLPLHS